jgi:predicted aspartyl protease
MPSYDAVQHEPAAPVARVMLRNPDNTAIVADYVLLMDTGADVTLLPLVVAEQLGVPMVADVQYELAAFDGTKSLVSVALIDMVFLNRVYRGRYLLVNAAEGVLGRDVLNHLSLLFDGPGQQWTEQTR